MNLQTLVIDDEPMALEKLQSYVQKIPYLELAGACVNGFEAMEIVMNSKVDLIITDINMPDLNGMDLIKTLSNPPLVIFTTAFDNYAVDSYRLSAVDYLLKPYTFVDFQRATMKAHEIFEARHREVFPTPSSAPDSIFIKVDYRYHRVNLNDIIYIKGYGEYLQIYLRDKSAPLLTLSSFAAILEKLSASFLQVHRSYIVNMNHVVTIEKNRVITAGDAPIPVSDSYKNTLQNYVAMHSAGK